MTSLSPSPSPMSAQSLREEEVAFLGKSLALCACSSVLYLILDRYLGQLKLILSILRARLGYIFSYFFFTL